MTDGRPMTVDEALGNVHADGSYSGEREDTETIVVLAAEVNRMRDTLLPDYEARLLRAHDEADKYQVRALEAEAEVKVLREHRLTMLGEAAIRNAYELGLLTNEQLAEFHEQNSLLEDACNEEPVSVAEYLCCRLRDALGVEDELPGFVDSAEEVES